MAIHSTVFKPIRHALLTTLTLVILSGCMGNGNNGDPVIESFVDEESFEYFPIDSNASWTYTDSLDNAQVWWLEDSGAINGYQTYALTREIGSREYYISDATGVYLIGLYIPQIVTSAGSFKADIHLNEPVPVLTREMLDTFDPGRWSHYSGQGTVKISPAYGNQTITYSATHNFIGEGQCGLDCMEDFNTQQIRLSLDITTVIEGYTLSIPVSFYASFAEGAGIVKFNQAGNLYLTDLSGIEIPEDTF